MRLVALALVMVACSFGDPSYDGTAFQCDDAHACPPGQTCVAGRCSAGGSNGSALGDGIKCAAAGTCAAGSACCNDAISGPRCIAAGDTCNGEAATCDGVADCATGQRCCTTQSPACGASTCSDAVCTTGADCPLVEPFCCFITGLPWGRCSVTPC
ncbi:MAG: hypothetical protein ACM31C_29580 [Acidobacteriota bacterium]